MKERYNHYPSRRQMPALIDFDGVLAKNIWPEQGIGDPLQGAREAIEELRQKHGKEIIVYTARADYEIKEIWRWLRNNHIRVDGVTAGKKSGHFYIGDEAIGHRGDWNKTLKEAERFTSSS